MSCEAADPEGLVFFYRQILPIESTLGLESSRAPGQQVSGKNLVRRLQIPPTNRSGIHLKSRALSNDPLVRRCSSSQASRMII